MPRTGMLAPRCLRLPPHTRHSAAMARRLVVLAVLLAGAPLFAACGSSGAGAQGAERPVVRLGTKNFTEQFILGELYAQALRAAGFRVQIKPNIGSSEVVDRALVSDRIDLYPEYTGVIGRELAGERRRPRSAAETYQRAKAFQAKRG